MSDPLGSLEHLRDRVRRVVNAAHERAWAIAAEAKEAERQMLEEPDRYKLDVELVAGKRKLSEQLRDDVFELGEMLDGAGVVIEALSRLGSR